MLDPRRLSLLVALDSLGTVRAVAAHASMSPSAVSQQLATLETETGVPLLVRHGRSVALTPAAQALVVRSTDILDRIALAEDELRGWRDGSTGLVRIGAFPSALGAFVIDAAQALAVAHPGLRVQLIELGPEHTTAALERGTIDIAILGELGDDAPPPTGDLERTALAVDELLAVLPVDHPADVEGPFRLEHLHDARWLMDGADLERHVIARCRRAGFEPAVDSRLSSHDALLHAVASGLGVTVLPSLAIDPAYAVRTRRLKPSVPRRLVALNRVAAARWRPIVLTRDAIVAAAQQAPLADGRATA